MQCQSDIRATKAQEVIQAQVIEDLNKEKERQA